VLTITLESAVRHTGHSGSAFLGVISDEEDDDNTVADEAGVVALSEMLTGCTAPLTATLEIDGAVGVGAGAPNSSTFV
jgi:hypothetical protein